MRNRIFFKLLAAFALVIATATATLDFSIHRTWEASLRQEIERNLRQKTVMFANRVNTDRTHNLQDVVSQEGQAGGARATVIDPQGKVLADSEAPPSTTEDHARTPEFAAALRGEIGSDVRQSRTVGVPLLYVAAPVEGGAVRLAYPLSDVQAALGRARHTLLLGSLLALAVALLISGAVAAFTARRLERIRGSWGAHFRKLGRRNWATCGFTRQNCAHSRRKVCRAEEQPGATGNAAQQHAGCSDHGGRR